jgi:hypothetical protein
MVSEKEPSVVRSALTSMHLHSTVFHSMKMNCILYGYFIITILICQLRIKYFLKLLNENTASPKGPPCFVFLFGYQSNNVLTDCSSCTRMIASAIKGATERPTILSIFLSSDRAIELVTTNSLIVEF